MHLQLVAVLYKCLYVVLCVLPVYKPSSLTYLWHLSTRHDALIIHLGMAPQPCARAPFAPAIYYPAFPVYVGRTTDKRAGG